MDGDTDSGQPRGHQKELQTTYSFHWGPGEAEADIRASGEAPSAGHGHQSFKLIVVSLGRRVNVLSPLSYQAPICAAVLVLRPPPPPCPFVRLEANTAVV